MSKSVSNDKDVFYSVLPLTTLSLHKRKNKISTRSPAMNLMFRAIKVIKIVEHII